MDPQDAIDLARQAMLFALLIGAPMLVTGLVMGLLIGFLQAITQIQEQTVAFVPKIVAMIVVLMLALPWLLEQMSQYSQALFGTVPGGL
jgi:flagellar biosynthetic protein FliQ